MPNSIVVNNQPSPDDWPELVAAVTKLSPQKGDILIVDDTLNVNIVNLVLEAVTVPVIPAPTASIKLLHPREGDILVVTGDIDPAVFQRGFDGVAPIPILFVPADSIHLVSKAEAKHLLEEISNG